MLRLLLSALLVLQVSNAWGWDWNWKWNNPCHYIERMNCNGGYLADAYYRRDGDRDGDWDHRHGHDNDNDWNNRHGHDNDNDWNNRHGHDNDNDWNNRHGHDNDNDWNNRHGHDNDNDWNRLHEHNNGFGRHGHHFEQREICGSDGVTYKNRCYFRKAQCKHKIVMRHEGACAAVKTDAPKPTTVAPKQTTPKVPVMDEFCRNLLGTLCHGVSPICGTNDQSYDNECEFEKAKCTDATLHVKHLGTC